MSTLPSLGMEVVRTLRGLSVKLKFPFSLSLPVLWTVLMTMTPWNVTGNVTDGRNAEDSVQNLETPSAPSSITKNILNKALCFQKETNRLPLIEFFKLLKIAASIPGCKLQPLLYFLSSPESYSEPPRRSVLTTTSSTKPQIHFVWKKKIFVAFQPDPNRAVTAMHALPHGFRLSFCEKKKNTIKKNLPTWFMLPSQNTANQTLNISEMETGDDECRAASGVILHKPCGWPEEGGRWRRTSHRLQKTNTSVSVETVFLT